MDRSTLQELECSMCSAKHSVDCLRTVCETCGELLLARYDLPAAARSLRRDAMSTRPATLWRYAEVLPGSELLPRAWQLAEQLAQQPPLVLRYTRVLLTMHLKRMMQDMLGYGLALEGMGSAQDQLEQG